MIVNETGLRVRESADLRHWISRTGYLKVPFMVKVIYTVSKWILFWVVIEGGRDYENVERKEDKARN